MVRSRSLLLVLGVGAVAGMTALAASAQEPPAIIAIFEVVDEQFRVRIENPATIEQLRALERGESSATIPIGRLLRGADGNEPWSWHLDPHDIEMAEITIELCDGRPSFVEADLDYWVDVVGSYCPWSAVLVDVEEVGGATPSPTTTPEPSSAATPTSPPPAALPDTGTGSRGGGGIAAGLLAALIAAAGVAAAGGLVLARQRAQ